ncbi:hypothetical protein BDV93DRAFT_559797 [Ceratobasidium sp. AG-I]|nr:hypothetical protein BDV93DRAFT_559797 [Ceratobasidium sp. AG-I]
MILIRNLVLFLTTTLTLVLASPTSDPSTGEPLARARAALKCGSHASPSAIAASQSNITAFGNVHPQIANPIPIYWHVIYKNQTYSGGFLSNAQILAQVAALNTNFLGTGISFRLVGLTSTRNGVWFDSVTATNDLGRLMKQALHRGGRSDLNIYSVGFQTTTLGGFTTWPWDYIRNPKLDGVVFKWNTIPGGTLPGYTQGKILVHQAGHWCGLYHTFEGGCSASGDFVSDTPAESGPHFGCPTGSDTCPGGGVDPIHNFMDYTNDPCKTHFTSGQATRMRTALALWR